MSCYGNPVLQIKPWIGWGVSDVEWQAGVDLAACYGLIALHGWGNLVFTKYADTIVLNAGVRKATSPTESLSQAKPMPPFDPLNDA